jgi:hypothetical protein
LTGGPEGEGGDFARGKKRGREFKGGEERGRDKNTYFGFMHT